jgi:DNA-binding protein HU-beta
MANHTTRDDIAQDLIGQGMTATQARTAVDSVLRALARRLARGECIELRRFGSFHLKLSRPRPGRNPMKPDQVVKIPARWSIKFRPGKFVKDGLAEMPIPAAV